MVRDLGCDTRVRGRIEDLGQILHKDIPSTKHLEVLVAVIAGPFQGKVGSFEELFVGVLPRNVQLIEAGFRELLNEHAMARNHLFLCETRVEDEGIIPFSSQHTTSGIHANSSNNAWLSPQEAMIQEGDFGQELAQSPCLDIVIVCFAYLSHPAVRISSREYAF